MTANSRNYWAQVRRKKGFDRESRLVKSGSIDHNCRSANAVGLRLVVVADISNGLYGPNGMVFISSEYPDLFALLLSAEFCTSQSYLGLRSAPSDHASVASADSSASD